MAELYSILLEDSTTEVVELSDGTKRFFKQLVRFGKWVDPLNPTIKMALDKKWASKIVENFKAKVAGRVAVPLSHTDMPEYNTGEVTSLEIRDDGLYGTLDIRDQKTALAIEDDLIWDVSVSFDNEYQDKKSGEVVGPTLLHVALVNNPYLKGMKPFQAFANRMKPIMLSESKEYSMSRIANGREFPVTVKVKDENGKSQTVELMPGQDVEVADDQAEDVNKQIEDAKAPKDQPKETPEPVTDRGTPAPAAPELNPNPGSAETPPPANPHDANLSEENARLRKEIALRDAEASYSKLLSEGKIVPAQKDAYIALSTSAPSTVSLSDGSSKSSTQLLAELFESGPKKVEFGEKGSSGDESVTPWEKLSDEQRAASIKLGVNEAEYNKVNAPEQVKQEA